MTDIWLRTDEAQDVMGSLRHAIRVARFVREDPAAWKWVILALHSALAGSCVCHLTTIAAPVGSVSRKNASEWLAYFEASRTQPNAKQPDIHVMALPELLKAVRKPNSAGDQSNAAGVNISDVELNELCRLHRQVRNQFSHFGPMGWSLDVSSIPKLAVLIARIIDEILHFGWVFRHLSAEQKSDLKCSLRALAEIGRLEV